MSIEPLSPSVIDDIGDRLRELRVEEARLREELDQVEAETRQLRDARNTLRPVTEAMATVERILDGEPREERA